MFNQQQQKKHWNKKYLSIQNYYYLWFFNISHLHHQHHRLNNKKKIQYHKIHLKTTTNKKVPTDKNISFCMVMYFYYQSNCMSLSFVSTYSLFSEFRIKTYVLLWVCCNGNVLECLLIGNQIIHHLTDL